MKFVIAMMKHETNTFSPVPTPFESFGNRGAYFGQEAFAAYKDTNTPMAAYIDLATEQGAEIVTPVAAEAFPSGPVHREAYERLTDAICDAVLGGSSQGRAEPHSEVRGIACRARRGSREARPGYAPGDPCAKALRAIATLSGEAGFGRNLSFG